jgi:hypothetical protein
VPWRPAQQAAPYPAGVRARRPAARAAVLAVVLAAVALLPACSLRWPGTAAAPTPTPRPTGAPGTALAVLGTLAVRPFAEVDGYAREAFGQRWKDVDRNGCDTRNDVLRRDLADVVADPRTNGCVVRAGTLVDPYTGSRVGFVRGPATSPLVEIDHVVALAAAWRTGAATWDADRRERFANDPLNLLATTRASNQGKGSSDAARWLPPLVAARCPFAARQVAVKARWALTVTPQEAAALGDVLARCPAQPLPADVSPGAG